MKYSLYRLRDKAGDSGPMSLGLYIDDGGKIQEEWNARPRVGLAMRVGTPFARSYSNQDWWQTTPVTEILEDTGDTVRFKTNNSEYVWKEF